MSHPNQTELALYAGGDLGLWAAIRLRRHAARCPECHSEIVALEKAGEDLRALAARMPASIDWRGLEAEMKANIHLGFVAGACVTPLKQGRWVAWRPAAALASVMVLAAMSWWLQAPEPGSPQSAATGVFLEATPSGIEMQENGRGLTLMYPRSESVIRTVSAQGALRARYVDADGQVTISNVYVQ